MTDLLRARLRRGDLLLGTMATIAAPEVTELLSMIGFDWLFLDGEHGALAARDIQMLLQAAGGRTPCLVRVPAANEVAIKQALDVGADGIIVPQVNSAAQAEAVVRYARYAPEGARGVGLARAHGYGLSFQEYVNAANERTVVVVQVEHRDAVAQIDAIVRVRGVDAVLVGPYDLSASMGLMGQVEHPEVQAAITRVTQACRAAGMPAGIFGVHAAAVRPWIAAGYTLIAAATDMGMLGLAARNLLSQFRPPVT